MAKVKVEKTATTKTARSGSKMNAKSIEKQAQSSKHAVKTIAVNSMDDGEGNPKSAKVPKSSGKDLVVRPRAIDPELALMASRAAAAERPRPDITRIRRNGRSVSGMVVTPVQTTSRAVSQNVAEAEVKSESKEDAKFSKFKSALVGVGVALVVAVVGFAGIALFGNNKKMCTVHFESNGGSKVSGTEIVCGRTVKQPDDPTKDGFSFEGWILEGDPFDFTTGIYKNATLVAKWKANEDTEIVTVKFDSDGGSVVGEVEVAKGRPVSRPAAAPTRMGYVFENWYLGDEVYDFSKPVNENITLRAKWTRRTNENGNNNNSSDNNTVKPNNRVTSVEVNDMAVKVGEMAQTTVMLLPSAAEFKLVVSVGDTSIATCGLNGITLTCKGEGVGSTKVIVREELSGNMDELTVTVTEAPHEHVYVDGKCDCGAIDPNHEHQYDKDAADGKCTVCGQVHDPHSYDDKGVCTGCGMKNPDYKEPQPPQPEEPGQGGTENPPAGS